MLFQACMKCGTMLNETQPQYPISVKNGSQTNTGVVCQKCNENMANANDNSKLLNG